MDTSLKRLCALHAVNKSNFETLQIEIFPDNTYIFLNGKRVFYVSVMDGEWQ